MLCLQVDNSNICAGLQYRSIVHVWVGYDWFDLSLNKFNRELTFNLVQVIKLELNVYIIARTLRSSYFTKKQCESF